MNMHKTKKIIPFIFIVILVIFLFSLLKLFITNRQIINIITREEIATNDTIEACVSVKNKDTKQMIKTKLIVSLLNENGRRVKNCKEIYNIEADEKAAISMPLPSDIEPGQYYLKFKSQAGIFVETYKMPIYIYDRAECNIVISLDKGIYKPGDEVNFRALVLSKKDDTPIQEPVSVIICDGNDNKVYIDEIQTSEYGAVSGKFLLANEVNSGEYKIIVSTKNKKQTKTFNVNPYVLPNFELTVNNMKNEYKIGDVTDITINAKYFFGEPVKNANVSIKLNEKNISGLTDDNGNFVISKQITDIGKNTLNIQVIDSSNYLIEKNESFYATNNPFEIKIIPENKVIYRGIENSIYFVTNKISGQPIKAHIQVLIGDLRKQVITDESGIGILKLSADETDKFESEINIEATAIDADNNKVISDIEYETVYPKGAIINLDKYIYKQNEDITINLHGAVNIVNKEIYIFKNDQLIKVITTDNDKAIVNLENVYGLVDIYAPNLEYDATRSLYVPEMETRWDFSTVSITDWANSISNPIRYQKQTIYIKPDKSLNVDISTNKEEYLPGEKMELKVNTKNENGEAIDANLLISILDEAVLSLAENDLSIDNIKLALGNLKLSDGISLADIYAEVLEEKSDFKLRTALISQNDTVPDLKKINSGNDYQTINKYLVISFITGIITVAMLFGFLIKKFVKFRIFIFNIVNLVFIYLVCCIIVTEFLEYTFSGPVIYISALILAVTIYVLLLYKKCEAIFEFIFNLCVIPGITAVFALFSAEMFYSELLTAIIIFLPFIILTILMVLDRKFNFNTFFKAMENLFAEGVIAEISWIVSIIITNTFGFYELGFIITIIIIYWIIRKIYLSNNKKEKIVITTNNITAIIFVIVLTIGIILAMVYSVSNTFSNGILSSESEILRDDYISEPYIMNNSSEATIDSFISKGSSIFDTFEMEQSKDFDDGYIDYEDDYVEESIEENVRNVFLESLLFVPKLVTTNGTVNTEFELSDNITTWNIQAIGNTKDGRVGYNNATFKVYKDFFVDFSLPTNSIVTDKISIPVTVYNYQENPADVNIIVKENDWSVIGNYTNVINVPAKSTKMIYVPIELTKDGSNTLRIEAKQGNISDIVEKTLKISPNGFKIEKVVSSGSTDDKITIDHFTTDAALENTRKLKVKLYPSIISQTLEGLENIFKMPTGCFEQTTSSLYPNILALKYLNDTKLDDLEIREKALKYISSGYQRILTFETHTKGGYSLYGDGEPENVLTALGLMELTDLKSVYEIDESVITNMINYLFSEQKVNGAFTINSTYIGNPTSEDDLAMNAYIIWALSEACPDDSRINTSVKYLESKLDKADDNYTIALMANVFANTNSSYLKTAIKKLMANVVTDNNGAYVKSNVTDYWGTRARYQNIQTTALTSMALTKAKSNYSTNSEFIDYLIATKDCYGTWGTTQATILALKAINNISDNANISNQKIEVSVNNDLKDVEIKDYALDLYELVFDKINNENKISISHKKGTLYYEIIEEYYVPYENLETMTEKSIIINKRVDTIVNVNDIVKQHIEIKNTGDEIRNALVQICIPQGTSVNEVSLNRLKNLRLIEKYEYNYNVLNLYIRNFRNDINLDIEYKANFPAEITGGMIRCYDYYNPINECYSKPEKLIINN